MYYPILMADIINSSEKDSVKLMRQFKDLVLSINKTKNENLLSPLTITLGDEFQGIVDTLENGIKTIFDIEEMILNNKYDLKIRYVLFYGKIDTEINNKLAYEMLGEGLTDARKKLTYLKNTIFRFHINLGNNETNKEEHLNKAFFIYQNFVDSWKEKDKEIVCQFLLFDDYKIVAKNVNIDQSNAWRRKRSLRIEEYKDIKNIISYILTA
jgi:hypothetical protein